MLELDYAFLADFATIQDGTLTVVGASFTRMVVTEYPTFALLGVAGRIRCDEPDRNTINVTLRITSPGAEPTTIEGMTRTGSAAANGIAPSVMKERPMT